ncbi:MAG: hypothetical protein ABI699_07450 [Caldimonas sp.]
MLGTNPGASALYRLIQAKVKYSNTLIIPERPYSVASVRRETLPFRVHLVDDAQDIQKAVEIRSSAYMRHLPTLGETLRTAESEDFRSDVLLLIAERKIDRRAIGSMRLQPNFNRPLRVEGEMALPAVYRGRRLVETTRLGVENGMSGTLVMVAMVKAAYEICHACGVDYALAAGRRSMAELFRSLCYDELGGPIPVSYANDVPHWIFAIPIREVDERLRAKRHAYYEFMARTDHPDIEIDYERVFDTFGSV